MQTCYTSSYTLHVRRLDQSGAYWSLMLTYRSDWRTQQLKLHFAVKHTTSTRSRCDKSWSCTCSLHLLYSLAVDQRWPYMFGITTETCSFFPQKLVWPQLNCRLHVWLVCCDNGACWISCTLKHCIIESDETQRKASSNTDAMSYNLLVVGLHQRAPLQTVCRCNQAY